MSNSMIFQRYEIKYMLTTSQRDLLLETMQARMIPDIHGKSTICSLYFDTPDHLLIRRSLEHPLYKEKLRVRSYGTARKNTEVFIELKKKYKKIVYKRRIGMTEAQAKRYLLHGESIKQTQISKEIDYCMKQYQNLLPSMMLSYEREAYYDKNDPDFRMTFDTSILWRTDHLSLCDGIFGEPLLAPHQVLLEVKTAQSIPLWLTDFLSANHIYKTSFSKYGTAYQTYCKRQTTKTHSPKAYAV